MNKITLGFLTLFISLNVFGEAKVMNPGEAHGQVVFLTAEDILEESEKYESLSPISIPVFAEMPFNMSVVAGAITLMNQGLLSHVQIKARARKIPNVDISALEGGMSNPLFEGFGDGDFIHLVAREDGTITVSASDESQAKSFYQQKVASSEKIELVSDLNTQQVFSMSALGWQDYSKVGSKAANYAELAYALNTPEQEVVRPSLAIPFFYYAQFIEDNPILKDAIKNLLRDPLMRRVSATKYRDEKLKVIRELIESDMTVIDEDFLSLLVAKLDEFVSPSGEKMKMKFRSSTNAEDLPNFNGAGLYSSKSYKPMKDGEERSQKKKLKEAKEALKEVWGSVWNLRAYEEREAFGIAHDEIYMGVQINPSYSNEEVDGVLVTANLAENDEFSGAGVYIEAQRGDEHSVANPEPGVQSEKILVLYDSSEPLNKELYQIHYLSQSNIADDMKTILPTANTHKVMYEREVKDLVFQSLKASEHFQPIFSADQDQTIPLDIEFKVDDLDSGQRQIYLKQVRPFIQ